MIDLAIITSILAPDRVSEQFATAAAPRPRAAVPAVGAPRYAAQT
jgi:hypothetical protein